MCPQTVTTGSKVALSERVLKIKKMNIRSQSKKSNHKKVFCEFFAGIGLVREGLHLSGWECGYANDIDPKKHEMYEGRFGASDHFHLGDVWDTEEVISRMQCDPFLATASFPCTDLSLAGKGKGFEGHHSSTFFGFIDAIKSLGEKRPKIVMLENVPGFITSHGGKDFSNAVHALADLGYWIDAFVLDAKYFVPQSRQRVFVIGLHESVETPIVTKQLSSDYFSDIWRNAIDQRSRLLTPEPLFQLMQSIQLPTGWMAFELQAPIQKRRELKELIDLDNDQEWWDEKAVKKHYDMMSDLHRGQVDSLLAQGGIHVGTIYRRTRLDKAMAEVRLDGTAGCLRTPRGGSARQIVIVLQNGKLRMRWMSAREYARLQGADNFPLTTKKNQNLFGFGDAVCVPVISWIDQNVLTPVYESIAVAI